MMKKEMRRSMLKGYHWAYVQQKVLRVYMKNNFGKHTKIMVFYVTKMIVSFYRELETVELPSKSIHI